MNRADLDELDALLRSARAVVPMRDIFNGNRDTDVVGLRHDVDDNPASLDTAVKLARWEHRRGYRSTFFMLHSAGYFGSAWFPDACAEIVSLGHEIGIHANALPAALATGRPPQDILRGAIDNLRSLGLEIIGVAPHGDPACRDETGRILFVNDEIFSECGRSELGEPDRTITRDGRTLRLQPVPLAAFGLRYETYRLPRGRYLSDSGGNWNTPLSRAAKGAGQLHILQHPDWWREAFDTEAK